MKLGSQESNINRAAKAAKDQEGRQSLLQLCVSHRCRSCQDFSGLRRSMGQDGSRWVTLGLTFAMSKALTCGINAPFQIEAVLEEKYTHYISLYTRNKNILQTALYKYTVSPFSFCSFTTGIC